MLILTALPAGPSVQHRPRPGKFEGVNPEEVEGLQRDLAAVASPEFAALLFNKDFKRQLDAVERLLQSLEGLLAEVQANLDLLLRWAVLRICDGNMQARCGVAGNAWRASQWQSCAYMELALFFE